MDTLKILIVEDEKDIANMYKIKLEKEWMQVTIADNWISAASLVAEFKPNVILLDIMMPWMDWFETLRVMRELAPSLESKIIMFSNLNSKDDIERCMKNWADAYLLKANTTPRDVFEKIVELTSKKEEIKSNQTKYESCTITKEDSDCMCPHCWKEIRIKVIIEK